MTNTSSNRIEAAVASVFNAQQEYANPTYTTDSKGRQVRVFSANAPLTAEIVRHFYLGNRIVDDIEALETIGYNGLQYQLKAGHLVEDHKVKGRYWITQKAAQVYSLPKPACIEGTKHNFYPTPK